MGLSCDFPESSVVNSRARNFLTEDTEESKRSAKFLFQYRWFRRLVVALGGRVCAGLENVAVASANYQFRPVDANLDCASFSGTRGVFRIVTKTVLTS